MDNPIKIKKHVAITLSVLLAVAVGVFVVMLLFNVTDYGITIASFGATLFMVLSRKDIDRRKIFGSYAVATLIGYSFSKLSFASLNVAMATVVSFLIMTFLELQHPPALGISIALVLNRFSLWTDVIVLLCIFAIIGMTILLKHFLNDPNKVFNFVEIEEEKIKWNLKPKHKPEYIRL